MIRSNEKFKKVQQDSNMDIWLNQSRDLESFKMGLGFNEQKSDKSIIVKSTSRSEKQLIQQNNIVVHPHHNKAVERNKKFINQYGRIFLTYKIHQDHTYIPISVTNSYISNLKKKKEYNVKSLTIEKKEPPIELKKLIENKTYSSGFFLTEKKLGQQRPQSCKKLFTASEIKRENLALTYKQIYENIDHKQIRDLKFVPFTGKFKHKPIKIDTGFKTITLKEKPQSAKVPYMQNINNTHNLEETMSLRPNTAKINRRSKLITPKEKIFKAVDNNSQTDELIIEKDEKFIGNGNLEDSPRKNKFDKYFKGIDKHTSPIKKNLNDNLFVTKGRDIEIQIFFKEGLKNSEKIVTEIEEKFNLNDSEVKQKENKNIIHPIQEETNLEEISGFITTKNKQN